MPQRARRGPSSCHPSPPSKAFLSPSRLAPHGKLISWRGDFAQDSWIRPASLNSTTVTFVLTSLTTASGQKFAPLTKKGPHGNNGSAGGGPCDFVVPARNRARGHGIFAFSWDRLFAAMAISPPTRQPSQFLPVTLFLLLLLLLLLFSPPATPLPARQPRNLELHGRWIITLTLAGAEAGAAIVRGSWAVSPSRADDGHDGFPGREHRRGHPPGPPRPRGRRHPGAFPREAAHGEGAGDGKHDPEAKEDVYKVQQGHCRKDWAGSYRRPRVNPQPSTNLNI